MSGRQETQPCLESGAAIDELSRKWVFEGGKYKLNLGGKNGFRAI